VLGDLELLAVDEGEEEMMKAMMKMMQ